MEIFKQDYSYYGVVLGDRFLSEIRKYRCGFQWESPMLDPRPTIEQVSKLLNAKPFVQMYTSPKNWFAAFSVKTGALEVGGYGAASVVYYTNEPDTWEPLKKRLMDFFAKYVAKGDAKSVPVNFVYMDEHRQAQTRNRNIECPKWEQICDNYPAAPAVEGLFKTDDVGESGKLIFWHGLPGTGKTYAIRALFQEWREKAEFYYVMDPEKLLESTAYLFSVLADKGKPEDLKVLVLEDSLDFLLAENRKIRSSPIARLLNLTEGIMGQGFRILLLITTNESLGEIDPAFIRPGRCLQALEFRGMDRKEAAAWAKKNKSSVPDKGGEETWTLAELYGARTAHEVSLREENRLGF